jgi:hypothetical protein
MPTTTLTQTVPLGDLVAAVFDQEMGQMAPITGDVAADVVTEMLLRTGNTRALRALQAFATASR